MDEKHLLEKINEQIAEAEDKVKRLQKLKSEINRHFYLSPFKCPIELTNYEAVCPQCKNALPQIIPYWNHGGATTKHIRFVWPHDMSDDLKDESKREGCSEWEKKQRSSACGCGGVEWCLCGYYSSYCISVNSKCPFCGRGLQSKASKKLWTNRREK